MHYEIYYSNVYLVQTKVYTIAAKIHIHHGKDTHNYDKCAKKGSTFAQIPPKYCLAKRRL